MKDIYCFYCYLSDGGTKKLDWELLGGNPLAVANMCGLFTNQPTWLDNRSLRHLKTDVSDSRRGYMEQPLKSSTLTVMKHANAPASTGIADRVQRNDFSSALRDGALRQLML